MAGENGALPVGSETEPKVPFVLGGDYSLAYTLFRRRLFRREKCGQSSSSAQGCYPMDRAKSEISAYRVTCQGGIWLPPRS